MKLTKNQESAFPANIYLLAKRLFSLFLCLIILFFAACEKTPLTPENEDTTEDYTLPEQSITLGYAENDSLNPYFSQSSLNVSLSDLVYSKLYKLDNGFNPLPEIAVFSTLSDTELKVNIHSDLFFSDNSNITAIDVAYSFNQVKLSQRYAESLANISGAEATSAYEVTFSLLSPDPHVKNLLDFPIVKNKTADLESDLPIGSALYCYRRKDDLPFLEHNMLSPLERPNIGTIKLLSISDSSRLDYDLETGEISAYYTDLNSKRLSRIHASFAPVQLNNFVYLGINQSNFALSFQTIRQAISLCLGRDEVCGTAYQGNAQPAYTIFNPKWTLYTSSKMSEVSYKLNIDAGIKILDDLGYTSRNSEGARTGIMGTLSFNLLINADNEYKQEAANMIAQSLLKSGIKIHISALPWEEYLDALSKGNYDLYLAELKIPSNMNFSAIFSEDGSASFGINPESKSAALYKEYEVGSITPEAFNDKLQDEMPLIPICYRQGLLIMGKHITSSGETLVSNIFENISTWRLN